MDGIEPTAKILDIRVEPGGLAAAQRHVYEMQTSFPNIRIILNEFVQ